MSEYSIPPSSKCPSCFFDLNDPTHFRLHVLPKNWPAWMSVSGGASAPASTVLADVADAGTARPPETDFTDEDGVRHVSAHALTCPRCGFAAKSAAGKAAHQRKHRAVTA